MYSCPTTRSATWLLTSWMRRASAVEEACVATILLVKDDLNYPAFALQFLQLDPLAAGQRAHSTRGEIAQCHGAELHSHEPVHLKPERLT